MIECKFCLSSKSKSYVYTVCDHFVCINCASLRANQSLKCCNQITQLSEEVKQTLKLKKNTILNNLANQYDYQKTEREQNNEEINQQENNIEIKQQKYYQQQQQVKKYQSAYDNFYDRKSLQEDFNPKNINNQYSIRQSLQQQFYQNSPIKKVQYILHQQKHRQPIKQLQQLGLNTEFRRILDEKIVMIHESFKQIHQQLYRKQQMLTNQMKRYFEEYQNNLELNVDNRKKLNKISQFKNFNKQLDQQMNKWNLNQLSTMIKSFPKYLINKKIQQVERSQLIIQKKPQQSIFSIHQNIKSNNSKRQQSQKRNYRQYSVNQNKKVYNLIQNLQPQPESLISHTSRNMDKIYRKLQESRSKLEQRINRHNWFMTDRCKNLQRA